MPAGAGVRTRLAVLLVAAAGHDVLAKLMYAQLPPPGGGSAAEVRAGAQLMFYGGDAIEVPLAVALLLPWHARGGRRLAHERRRAAATWPAPGQARTVQASATGSRGRTDGES